MLKRSQITMSGAELEAFLAQERVVTCATMGPNGRPHLMPLWYVADGTIITTWTFGKSQKVRNLERLPRATLQVEAGDRYVELRGAMLECDVELIRDLPAVTEIGLRLGVRYAAATGGTVPTEERRQLVARQAPKRIGLRFHPTRIVTWDHRKLGTGY
ncbi:MAG: pyridoxamine 5'-phosphate oxidase family protein [Candidatus Rokubacteria bacterium]|nr:pyridoxamine 5'-phosphate oxidase family protein [Candidatus Rokubacteria bacterium]MBI2526029.1 pyridoxamine 5'-phosphate oxidase family protein [Candidatus Rokubacteria bacterium]